MKGKAPAARTSVTSATAAKASKQHAVAVAKLDHLIGGDRKASMTDQETDTVEFASMSAKASKVTALAVAQSQITDAQRTVELLNLTYTEKKIDDDNKKACYFKAHAHAMKSAINRAATVPDFISALNEWRLSYVRISHRWCSSERHEQTTTIDSPLGKDDSEIDSRD